MTGNRSTSSHGVIREGLIAGLIGGLAVAAWFFILDLVAGQLLQTPATLGSALFYRASTPSAVEVSALTVLGYTVVHFAAFAVAGIAFAALVTRAEKSPPLLLGLVLLFVTFETLLLGMVAILAAWLLEVLAWWSIGVGNLIAAAAMAIYLWRAHPKLRSEVARAEADDESLEAEPDRSTHTG